MATIYFFNEDINFSLKNKQKIKTWIKEIIAVEGFQLVDLNFIFCSDNYLHQLNLQYLNHDDYTDIITFDKTDVAEKVSGDIFISIDRVFENASNFGMEKTQEIRRIIIHGVYHLLGYKDKSKQEKKLMTDKENEALSLWEKIDVPRGTSSQTKPSL
ncbi:MAG: rRNA maturation RNase YbeY [Bacteroidota bacterium]|nr:rRNA maturation RNase YbeY [Bacteroidota bacterium]